MKNYNLLKDLLPKAHHSKNGFDRSSRDLFSMKAGMLVPVKCVETVPNGYYEIDIASLVRTLPMVSAPYTQMTLHFDTFFVPYSSLWHGWDTFRAQRENYDTSYHQSYLNVPMLDMYNFAHDIYLSWDSENERWKNPEDIGPDAPVDLFGNLVAPNALRFAGLLGYGGPIGTPTASKLLWYSETCYGKKLNLWRPAAYQKIFQDHYMNPYYELPNPFLYNFDDIDCSTPELSVISNANACKATSYAVPANSPIGVPRGIQQAIGGQPEVTLFTPRYRRWKQDLFMGLLPNPQFGDVSMMSGTDFTLRVEGDNLPSTSLLRPDPNSGIVGTSAGTGTAITLRTFSVDNLISVLDERRAKALQKWKETTMRAGFRARSQAVAHDGVAPAHSQDHRAVLLGSSQQIIGIDEVVATAQTGTSEMQSLGDIAGKGIGVMHGDKIKYEATEFGVIMVIASIEPLCLYAGNGISAFNTKVEQFDYFTEEFENLGFAAVPQYCLSGFSDPDGSIANPILGYAPRYWEYKTDFDRVHGEFEYQGSLSAWTITRNDYETDPYTGGFVVSDFYINPQIVDSIFGVNSDVNERTDQFWLNTIFDVKAIQPMNILGLPY